MAQNRQELLFPFGGLNDSEAASDQPDGTTVEAVNMRPFDPTNGKRRGSQRSGLRKYASVTATEQINGSERIQALIPVTYDKRRISYEMLTMPTKEWEAITPSLGTGYAAEVDAKGTVYMFDGINSILKYNPDGVLLDTITLPTAETEEVITRIAIDEFDSLFVAINGTINSRVLKYSYDEDRGYLQDWDLPVFDLIRDFKVKSDVLTVAIDTDSGSSALTSSINAYVGTSFTTVPTLAWSKQIPGPVSGLEMTNSSIFYISQPNATRGLQNDTYYYNTVNWTPTELTRFAQRSHFWFDASNLEASGFDVDDGVRITDDIGNITTRTDYSDFTATDTTERRLLVPSRAYLQTEGLANIKRKGPKFSAQAFGQYPALRFEGPADDQPIFVNGNSQAEERLANREIRGQVLISDANDTREGKDPLNDAKSSQTGSLEDNQCPIPGHKDQKYIFAIVGRISDWSQNPSVVFTAQDGGTVIGDVKNTVSLAVNLGDSGKVRDEGKITFVMKNAAYGASAGTADSEPFDLKAISPTGDFILTYAIDGGTGKSCVRINGRALDCMTITQTDDTIQMQAPATLDASGDETTFGTQYRQHAGRFVLGGPTQGWTMSEFDKMQNQSGDPDRIVENDPRDWFAGAALFCSYKIIESDLSDAGYLGFGPVGNPTPNSTDYDSGTDGADSPVGNMEFFNGHIAEICTILSDHDSAINDKAVSIPLNTSASKAAARGAASNSANAGTSTEIEKLEGYLAWKWGIPFVLPSTSGGASDGLYIGHPFKTAPPATTGSTDILGYDNSDYEQSVGSQEGIVGKLEMTGQGQWAASGAGIGYGLVANNDGDLFTVGPLDADGTDPSTGASQPWVQARKIIDKGTTYSTLPEDGAWAFSEPTELDAYKLNYLYPRLSLDSDGNLYWPLSATTKSSHVRKLTGSDGTLEWSYEGLNSSQQAYSVALPQSNPDYDNDDIKSPEFLYVSADNGGTNTLAQLTKLRLVTASQDIADGLTTRDTKLLAIAGGNMVSAGKIANTAPTDGTSALTADGLYVSGVAAFRKVYVTDGLTYKVYDPKTETVSNWTAEKSGEIPPRCKLIALWRGRMVLGRDPDDPHNWHMSAMGDPNDWDQDPAVPVATQAISGNNARAGKLADMVNTIIPYNDDLLLFGCDSKIYRLTGDPMAGGQLDLVSESTGIAFGKSWCKDPEGVIYFFGSRGGVFAMTPTGEVQNISGNKIERRLQEIELDRHRVELIWNDREQGLHVVQIPYNYKDMSLTSWFWCRRHNAWFEDELTANDKQFTAMAVMDGDKYDDRVLVFGCEDGRLRRWDEKKDDDDGDPIFSRVLIGPITDEASDQNFRFGKVLVELAKEQGGANYDFFSSRVADRQGGPLQSGSLQAGANGLLSGKQRGGSAWIRLRSGADDQRWALESISMAMYPAGRKRIR